MKAILTIMVSLLVVCSVYAEEPKVFTDQDLSKYSYDNPETLKNYERKEQQIQQEKKKDILYDIRIILAEDIPKKNKCSKIRELIIKFENMIEGDKAERSDFASSKLSYNNLCGKY